MLTLGAQAHSREILLTTENTVSIKGAINKSSVNGAINDLIKLVNFRESNSPIYIVLNSPGGSVIDGLRLIDFANTFENIHTVCMFCASMAHGISQGIKGTRYATKRNLMMAHRAKGGFRGQFETGEVESQLRVFKALIRSLEQQNADRIGISLKSYKEKVRNEWWTFGQESVDQNVVDKTVDLKCSMELINKQVESTQMTLFGPVKGPLVSACPIT